MRRGGCRANIAFIFPLVQTAIAEHFQSFVYDERYEIIEQAFLKEQQAPAVLKGVDTLESIMEIEKIVK